MTVCTGFSGNTVFSGAVTGLHIKTISILRNDKRQDALYFMTFNKKTPVKIYDRSFFWVRLAAHVTNGWKSCVLVEEKSKWEPLLPNGSGAAKPTSRGSSNRPPDGSKAVTLRLPTAQSEGSLILFYWVSAKHTHCLWASCAYMTWIIWFPFN